MSRRASLPPGGRNTSTTAYLASLGYEVHAIDLNEKLTHNARKVSQVMGWSKMHSYIMDIMDMRSLEFPDHYFDFGFSICVFEHLDYPVKQDALREIARCLKPDGVLCITFDYKNPAPGVVGFGKDTRLKNRISNVEDIQRTFLETGYYELLGNQEFHDNGELYLIHRRFGDGKYTFGSLFLRKTKHPKPIAAERSVRETEPEIPIEPDPVLEPLPGGLFLSVVICTYNRPRLLREALTSLVEQTLPADRFEVIVVDNNSEDSTKEVVRELAATSPNIRSVRETKQGLSHSRNRGCEEARGDYVIYIDDDAKAHARYLATVYRAIQTHKPDILGGPIYPYYTDPRPAWFKDGYETRLNAKETGWSTTCRVSGSNYVIRRDLIKSLGMFDPSLGMIGDKVRLGEERALLNRYRERPVEEQRVYYHVGCVVYHHVPAKKMTLRYYLKRFYVAGRAKARLEGMSRERWGPLTRAKYITQSVWTCVRQSLMTMEKKRQMKQYLLERGGGFMFELGRAVGCLPRFTRRRPGEDEGPSS